jgi:hypothetical protein
MLKQVVYVVTTALQAVSIAVQNLTARNVAAKNNMK